jgi:uncharacterized protein
MAEEGRWLERLEEGRAAFNRGEFFEAHERWEDVWRVLAGAERSFVQGLIQVAAALHHLQAGRQNPALRLMRKGLVKLSGRAAWPALDRPVDHLVQQVRDLVAALEAPAARPPDPRAIELQRLSP